MVKRSNTSNKSKLSILENNSNNISTNSNNLELNSSKSNNLLDILNTSNINNLNNISTLLADIKLLTEDEVKIILKEIKRRETYMPPSVKRKIKSQEAQRRARRTKRRRF